MYIESPEKTKFIEQYICHFMAGVSPSRNFGTKSVPELVEMGVREANTVWITLLQLRPNTPNKAKEVAAELVHLYHTVARIKNRVDASPEPYRALIHETGIVPDVLAIDVGSEYYDLLVDEIAKLEF